MKSRVLTAIVSFLILVCWGSVGAFSGEDIKARMKERLPVIDTLKSQGIVGENNGGYLEFLGANKKEEHTVQAENVDRETVYRAIAKQEDITPELVGKLRAIKIAEKAVSGEWIQDQAGAWSQAK